MHRLKSILRTHNKIVIKIGTNLLADKVKGINLDRINEIARSVARLNALGNHIAIVSSGAIGAGVAALKLRERPKTIPEKQATAAIGQPLLMEAYENAFIAGIFVFSNNAYHVNDSGMFVAVDAHIFFKRRIEGHARDGD